jgi:hypothetical protein
MAVKYRFNPYAPEYMKVPKPGQPLDDKQKAIKSLEAQRANLDERLAGLGKEGDSRTLIEKALNLKPDAGILSNFIDVINRPVEGVKGLVSAAIDKDPTTDALTEAKRGISGERGMTSFTKEILEPLLNIDSTQLQPAVKLAFDIGGDILFDPLTYVPAGAFTKLGKKIFKIGSRTVPSQLIDAVYSARRIYLDELAKKGGVAASKVIKSADEMADLVNAARKLDDIFEESIKTGKKLPDTFNKKGFIGEIGVRKHFEDFVKRLARKAGLADDAIVVLQQGDEIIKGTTRKAKDLGVYVKYIDPDTNITHFVRVAQAETKTISQGLYKAGKAYATNTRILARDVDLFLAGKLPKRAGNQQLGRRFLNKVGNIDIAVKGADGKRVVKKIAQVLKDGQGPDALNNLLKFGQKKGAYATEAVRSSVEKAVKDLFFDDLAASGVNYLAFRYGTGATDIATLSLTSARKYTRMSASIKPVVQTTISSADNLRMAFPSSISSTDFISFAKPRASTVQNLAKSGLTDVVTAAKAKLKSGKQYIKMTKRPGVDLSEIIKVAKEKGRVIDNVGEIQIERILKVGSGDTDLLIEVTKIADPAQTQFVSQLDLVDDAGKIINNKPAFDTLDETGTFFENVMKDQSANVQEVSLLARLANTKEAVEAGVALKVPVLTPAANMLRESLKVIKGAFNKGVNFTREQIEALSRISGKSANFASEKSAQLVELGKKLNQIDGLSEDIVTQIVESGAKLTEKGYLSRRVYSTEELITNIFINARDGGRRVFLPQIRTALQRKQIQNAINAAYRQVFGNADDVFEIVEKAGSYLVKTVGDFDARAFTKNGVLRRFLAQNGDDYTKKILNFGKYEFDDNVVKLWRENADLIEGYKSVRDDLVNVLKDELGFARMSEILEGKQGYLRHILTKDALDAQKVLAVTDTSRYVSDGLDLLKQRKYLGTADEINKAFLAFHDNVSANVFDMNIQNSLEDLIQVTSQRLEQHKTLELILKQSDKSGKSFLQVIDDTEEAASIVGKDFKVLGKNFKDEFKNLFSGLDPRTKEVLDTYIKNAGMKVRGKKIIIQNAAYSYLAQLDRAYLDLPQFVKNYDKFLNTWKSVTLVSPGYHLRNLIGNSTNSYLAGMNFAQQTRYGGVAFRDFGRFKQLKTQIAGLTPADITQRIARLGDKAEEFTKRLRFTGQINRPATWSIDDLVAIGFDRKQVESYRFVQDFMESGAAQSHKGVRDLEGVKRFTRTGKKSPVKEVVRLNYNLAEAADDYQRYMLYKWAYDKSLSASKGLNPAEAILKAQGDAATKVAEALFDYSHLTNFEKKYMKRLFPFYTFFKNNLIFQAKNLIKNPGRYATLGRAYKGITEEMGGMSIDDMPDYMRENMWLPLPIKVRKDDKESIAFLKSNLPLSDFLQFVENPFREGANFITTPVKMFFEFGTNREVFTGRAFQGRIPRAKSGAVPFLRGPDGTLSFQSGAMQKFAQDMGLRVPMNYASVFLDLLDTVGGSQSFGEGTTDFFKRMGLVGVQTQESLQLTALYQELERLRNQRKDYEARTGLKLPPKQRKKNNQLADIPGLDEYLRSLGG